MKTTLLAAAAALSLSLSLTIPATADEIGAGEGRILDVGATTGSIYYTVAGDTFEVVTTFAGGENAAPTRTIVSLQDGQSFTLSAPGTDRARARTLRVERRNDRLSIASEPDLRAALGAN